MPRRQVLSESERNLLTALPTSERKLARHYTLTEADRAWILEKRRDSNRLGFAVQLCLARHPGRALEAGEELPASFLSFIAIQLGIRSECWSDYAARQETRREHLLELRDRLGLRRYGSVEERPLELWAQPLAVQMDRGFEMVTSMIQRLKDTSILLPRLSVLERLAARFLFEGEQGGRPTRFPRFRARRQSTAFVALMSSSRGQPT